MASPAAPAAPAGQSDPPVAPADPKPPEAPPTSPPAAKPETPAPPKPATATPPATVEPPAQPAPPASGDGQTPPEPPADPIARVRELTKDLSKDDLKRLIAEDELLSGHVGDLANRKFQEEKRQWELQREQAVSAAQRQAEYDADPKAAWEKEKAETERLGAVQVLVDNAFLPLDNHLVERYQALPEEARRAFGFTPQNTRESAHADRIGFMDALFKAETETQVGTRVKKAEEIAYEAGRQSVRAELGLAQPSAETGAQGQPAPGSPMTQDEWVAHRNDREWVRQNKERANTARLAGAIHN